MDAKLQIVEVILVVIVNIYIVKLLYNYIFRHWNIFFLNSYYKV